MKRLLSLLLTCAFLLGALTACGGGKTEPQTASASEPASASTAAASAEPASAAAEPTEAELEPFTASENFPYPYSEELERDKTTGQYLLTLEQALYDYDTMWMLIRDNFADLDAACEAYGLDWQQLWQDGRDGLERASVDGKVTARQFVSVINSGVEKFRHAGHLFVMSSSFRESIAEMQDMDNYRGNLGALAANETSERFYRQEGLDSWLMQSQNSSGLSYEEPDGPDEVVQTVNPGVTLGYADGVPYVGMTSFGGWTDNTRNAVRAFLTRQTDMNDLILDIRGNGGGSDREWTQMVQYLTAEPLEWHRLFAMKTGALNLAVNSGYEPLEEQYICYTDDSWRERYPDVPADTFDGMDLVLEGVRQLAPSDHTIGYTGRVWLLVDGSVFSAAESFAYFCKSSGFAALVGTQTKGDGVGGGNPYVMALPYSGLLLYYAPYYGVNLDGTCNGIYGTMPDYETSAATALTDCLALIRQGG